MRLVIQRVKKASVKIEGRINGEIDAGMLILVGIEHEDTKEDIEWLTKKVIALRIFPDEQNKMNLDIHSINGSILVVRLFTLHATTKKGNRPSYIKAAAPEHAIPLYELFIKELRKAGIHVETGEFGAMMDVELINDGPVTILIDSKNRE